MNIEQCFEDLRGVLGTRNPDFRMEAGHARVGPWEGSREELAQLLGSPGVRGWVTTSGSNWCRLDDEGWRASNDQDGARGSPSKRPGPVPTVSEGAASVLCGELCLSDGSGLNLRLLGGELRGWRISEGPGADAEPVLWQRVQRASTVPASSATNQIHRVAWRLVDTKSEEISVPVLRPWLSRFVRWENG